MSDFYDFFIMLLQKINRAKTASDWGRTGWCILKSEIFQKFVKFRRCFTNFSNFSNFQKTHFCTHQERSNFGIKNSSFFLENLLTFCEYLPVFTTIFSECQVYGWRGCFLAPSLVWEQQPKITGEDVHLRGKLKKIFRYISHACGY